MGDESKDLVLRQDQALIERLATNPDVDVEKLNRILDMQERVIDKQNEQLYNAAMVQAQANMPVVGKDKDNTQTQSKYSSYEAILGATQPIYTAEGLGVSFYEEDSVVENHVRFCADVMHESGYTKKRHVDIPLDSAGIKGTINKTGPHAKVSSISYGRSVLMKMIFNIPTGDDDDGNGAGSQLITEDQENELHSMIIDNDLGEKYIPIFCKFCKVESLRDIKSKSFGRAKSSLNSVIAQVKK